MVTFPRDWSSRILNRAHDQRRQERRSSSSIQSRTKHERAARPPDLLLAARKRAGCWVCRALAPEVVVHAFDVEMTPALSLVDRPSEIFLTVMVVKVPAACHIADAERTMFFGGAS